LVRRAELPEFRPAVTRTGTRFPHVPDGRARTP
jgi:hypothetical protein